MHLRGYPEFANFRLYSSVLGRENNRPAVEERAFPLADARNLLSHVPAQRRHLDTWRHVAKCLDDAARGGDIAGAAVALRMVLMLEHAPCESQPLSQRRPRYALSPVSGAVTMGADARPLSRITKLPAGKLNAWRRPSLTRPRS